MRCPIHPWCGGEPRNGRRRPQQHRSSHSHRALRACPIPVTKPKAALATKELPKPETVLANVKAGVEKTVAVAKEVVDLAVAAQQRAYEVLTQRTQASVDELKAVAA